MKTGWKLKIAAEFRRLIADSVDKVLLNTLHHNEPSYVMKT